MLIPSAGVKVRIVRDGKVVASAMTNAKGAFSVSELSEGVAALIASGDDTLLFIALRLVNKERASAEAMAERLDVDAALVSGSDLPGG